MASPIPFVREIEFEYGRVDQVSPLIRRVIANNPGPFTFIGTGTYIVGRGTVAVLDPGPLDDAHFDALKAALEGETVSHVLVSHGHSDHSPLAKPMAEWAGCQTHALGGAVPTAKGELGSEDDPNFKPDILLEDGDVIEGPGWSLEAIATPGHTANHLCFCLLEENALFSGDHIMGWSTTIVAPPDGDMSDYMASLKKVQDRNFDILWPTHGAPIQDDVNGFIEAYMEHRRAREAAILVHLRQGVTSIREMVAEMYADVDKRLHPAAALSVLGHMRKLVDEGVVHSPDQEPLVSSVFHLVKQPAT
ncbi:MAG: MBL fold metallo-hydrolase [Pseudomonadota bacterium]